MNTWTMQEVTKATTGITMQHIEGTMTYIMMKYINEGYIFNTKESRVMYSDKNGFVKLYNPNAEENRKHIMIYITNEESIIDEVKFCIVYNVNLVVEESDKPYGTYKANVNKIELKYYGLNFNRWDDKENKTLLYTMDYDIAINSSKKRDSRRRNKRYEIGANELNNFDANKIINIVNKRNGYKSCRKSQIKKIYLHRDESGRVTTYSIYIEGKNNPVYKDVKR